MKKVPTRDEPLPVADSFNREGLLLGWSLES